MNKAFVLIVLMLSLTNIVQAQKNTSLFGFEGKVFLEDQKGKKVTITLYDGNKLVSSYITNSSGKFVIDIGRNKHFTVVLEKEGYLAKRVIINTAVKPNEAANVEDFNFDVILNKKESGINYAQLEFPISLIEFEEQKGQFDYNKSYTQKMMELHKSFMEQ